MEYRSSSDSRFSIVSCRGEECSFKNVQLLAGGLLKRAEISDRPVMLRTGDSETVSLIAACWLAGIPFYILPDRIPADISQIVNEIIRPQLFVSSENETQLNPVNGWISPTHLDLTEPAPLMSVEGNKPFGYFMTSGTSGTPKVVKLKRTQMIHAARAVKKNLAPAPNQGWMLKLPLNHIGGTSVVLRSLLLNCKVFDFRDVGNEDVIHALHSNVSISTASFVPTQLSSLLDTDSGWTTHRKFRGILLGGGPSSEKLINEARKRGIPVVKSYGMTETCAQITAVHVDEMNTASARSSGKLLPGNQLEIRDDSGQKCAPWQTGLIWVKGTQVISRYEFPASANAAFDGKGWFNTGDFGHIDSAGFLYVEMRRDDLIVSGGENVNPTYVEEVIKKVLPVSDVAVAGIDDEKWGQKVVAFIEDQSGYSSDELKKKLTAHLAPHELPREFIIVKTIPRNQTGKIVRNKLKSLYSG